MTAENLKNYLQNLPKDPDRLTVVGHPAPDTDAVISALFEAWRLTLTGTPAVPAVWGALPRETAWLLGDLAPLIPCIDTPPKGKAVLTDHHDIAAYPGGVAAVVDHHPVTDTAWGDIPAEVTALGATTTMICLRMQRDGLTPDPVCSRILLGAILLDTEGLSPYKAKPEDLLVARWLVSFCALDPNPLFAALRGELLSEENVTALYRRDYRRYYDRQGAPLLGFAILKVWADACPDLDAVRRLLAADDTPTRVAKIVLNNRDNPGRSEYYLAAGQGAKAVLEQVQKAGGKDSVFTAADCVFLPENGSHPGRKTLVPLLLEKIGKKSAKTTKKP